MEQLTGGGCSPLFGARRIRPQHVREGTAADIRGESRSRGVETATGRGLYSYKTTPYSTHVTRPDGQRLRNTTQSLHNTYATLRLRHTTPTLLSTFRIERAHEPQPKIILTQHLFSAGPTRVPPAEPRERGYEVGHRCQGEKRWSRLVSNTKILASRGGVSLRFSSTAS